jgi:hypothetical protein
VDPVKFVLERSRWTRFAAPDKPDGIEPEMWVDCRDKDVRRRKFSPISPGISPSRSLNEISSLSSEGSLPISVGRVPVVKV